MTSERCPTCSSEQRSIYLGLTGKGDCWLWQHDPWHDSVGERLLHPDLRNAQDFIEQINADLAGERKVEMAGDDVPLGACDRLGDDRKQCGAEGNNPSRQPSEPSDERLPENVETALKQIADGNPSYHECVWNLRSTIRAALWEARLEQVDRLIHLAIAEEDVMWDTLYQERDRLRRECGEGR